MFVLPHDGARDEIFEIVIEGLPAHSPADGDGGHKDAPGPQRDGATGLHDDVFGEIAELQEAADRLPKVEVLEFRVTEAVDQRRGEELLAICRIRKLALH